MSADVERGVPGKQQGLLENWLGEKVLHAGHWAATLVSSWNCVELEEGIR